MTNPAEDNVALEYEPTIRRDEAEVAVLGAALLDIEAARRVVEVLVPEDFLSPMHRAIVRVLARLVAEDAPETDVAALLTADDLGEIAKAGGTTTDLATIIFGARPTFAVPWYVARLRQASLDRQFEAEVHQQVDGMGLKGPARVAAVARIVEQHQRSQETSARTLAAVAGEQVEAMNDAAAAGRRPRGLPCGIDALDQVVGGFRPGELIIIGARPSVGKSALTLELGVMMARQQFHVHFASVEMSEGQLAVRALAAWAGLDHERVRDNFLTQRDRDALAEAVVAMADCPFSVSEKTPFELADAWGHARQLPPAGGVLVVDYLQLCRAPNRKDPREQQVAELSRGFKSIAKACRIPVVCVSAMKRLDNPKSNPVPSMQDLRESGAIESDADVVMLLHAPGREKDNPPDCGPLDVYVQKNRNGRVGVAHLVYDRSVQRIAGMSTRPDDPRYPDA